MASAERAEERRAKIKAILKDINTGEEKKIIDGLKALKVNGGDNVIAPIIDVWKKGVSPKAGRESIAFIGDINSSSSAHPMMDVLLHEDYQYVRIPLLSAIWNSKIE